MLLKEEVTVLHCKKIRFWTFFWIPYCNVDKEVQERGDKIALLADKTENLRF